MFFFKSRCVLTSYIASKPSNYITVVYFIHTYFTGYSGLYFGTVRITIYLAAFYRFSTLSPRLYWLGPDWHHWAPQEKWHQWKTAVKHSCWISSRKIKRRKWRFGNVMIIQVRREQVFINSVYNQGKRAGVYSLVAECSKKSWSIAKRLQQKPFTM